jgi:hypothetical protein
MLKLAHNVSRGLVNVSNDTDILPMVTNVLPMLAKESSIVNPQNVEKIDEKWNKNELFTEYPRLKVNSTY